MFRNEQGGIINTQRVETTEQKDAAAYIRPGDVVLELGARYGTVTYQIHKALKGRGMIVSIEPDFSVWNVLHENLSINGCMEKDDPTRPHLIPGVISKVPQTLVGEGYGAKTIAGTCANNNTTVDELYKVYADTFNSRPFTVVVADCEGCLDTVLLENPQLLKTVTLVLFEADGTRVKNARVFSLLTSAGFQNHTPFFTRPVWDYVLGFHSVWKR